MRKKDYENAIKIIKRLKPKIESTYMNLKQKQLTKEEKVDLQGNVENQINISQIIPNRSIKFFNEYANNLKGAEMAL